MFDVDGLKELQREARRITAGLAEIGGPDARAEGWDGSRTVRVTVDGLGRFVDAEVGPSWRDVLRPAELGAAVVEALDSAAAERMDAWTRATQRPADDARDDANTVDPWTADFGSVGGTGRFRSLRDPAVVESTRELYYLAMDAIDRLGEVSRAVEQVTTDSVSKHSPDRVVIVTVDGGRVVAVDFDQSWLRQATTVTITQRLRAAFSAVDQASSRSVAAKALDKPSIRELREVSADPRELLRRLGLG